jgi:hypothetical protein
MQHLVFNLQMKHPEQFLFCYLGARKNYVENGPEGSPRCGYTGISEIAVREDKVPWTLEGTGDGELCTSEHWLLIFLSALLNLCIDFQFISFLSSSLFTDASLTGSHGVSG